MFTGSSVVTLAPMRFIVTTEEFALTGASVLPGSCFPLGCTADDVHSAIMDKFLVTYVILPYTDSSLCKYDHVLLTDLSLPINPEDSDVVTAPMPYLNMKSESSERTSLKNALKD